MTLVRRIAELPQRREHQVEVLAMGAEVDDADPQAGAPVDDRVESEVQIDIPVCYDPEFGADLEAVARFAGLTPDDVVAIHSGRAYRVFMLGFLPGFPYMGLVHESIAVGHARHRGPVHDQGVWDIRPRLVCVKTGSAKSADRTGRVRFLLD